MAITGLSSSGKTTILHMVVTLVPIDDGVTSGSTARRSRQFLSAVLEAG